MMMMIIIITRIVINEGIQNIKENRGVLKGKMGKQINVCPVHRKFL